METYWATIAQICPVLGLALVIEGRALIVRSRKKSQYERLRFDRATYVVSALLAALALVAALAIALQALRRERDLDELAYPASLAVMFALGVVVLTPLTPMLIWTIADEYRRGRAVRRRRWVRRRREALLERISETERDERSAWLELLIETADVYTTGMRMYRAAVRAGDLQNVVAHEFALEATDTLRAKAFVARREARERFALLRENVDSATSAERLAEMEAPLSEALRKTISNLA